MNLVSNAIRYTRRGGILIGARRDGDGFRVEVVDTGIGIPKNKQVEIFEEFRRLGEDADQKDRGFGLGLAIVERIARILQHPLSVRSVPDRGSCFAIRLQASERRESVTADPCARLAAKVSGAGALLLVIENEAAICKGMKVLLRGWGYRVLAVASAAFAIAALHRHREQPAAIIADYHLDACTGMDAIGMVRASFGATIPAVLIAADRTREIQRDTVALRLPLLTKPVRPAQLRALLAHIVERPVSPQF